eukprot:1795754-Alexandrium_andersonii.AAC.1
MTGGGCLAAARMCLGQWGARVICFGPSRTSLLSTSSDRVETQSSQPRAARRVAPQPPQSRIPWRGEQGPGTWAPGYRRSAPQWSGGARQDT